MRNVSILLGFCALVFGTSLVGWSATSNTGNNPCFLVLHLCSNANTWWEQGVIDIGVDIGADGTYDYWLSQDTSVTGLWTSTKGVSDFDDVGPENWRTIIVILDQYAGETAKVKIVDNSAAYYIALNSIRLNYADGTVVPNGVPNGFFEEDPALSGWTVVDGNLTAAELVATDTGLDATPYGTKYLTTGVNGLSDTATIESDAFELAPIGSFIYGTFGGPASSRWDKPDANDSDNGIFVYVDVGTETEDPDGQYTEGVDVPLTGFYWQDADGAREAVVINTSGLEGRRAQVVAADVSTTHGIGLDAIRMNWDNSIIRNGGFEEGFEGGILPEGFEGTGVRLPGEHPSGGIPAWTINKIPDLSGNPVDDPDATFTFFGGPGGGFSRSGRVWVGSGSYDDGTDAPELSGVELRSDVFVIQPIPDPAESVFLSFNSAQSSSRIDDVYNPADGSGADNFSTIQLQVDMDGNGSFSDDVDFIYRNENQGMSWAREQFGEVDEWHYPEYRFYIASEHQGKTGRIYAAELLPGSWGWMAVDDFYFWDGSSADLAFPNSDFEMGDLTNWVQDPIGGAEVMNFGSWLAGTSDMYDAGRADHVILNDVLSWVDGDFAADSAESGDGNVGDMWSEPFSIPTLQVTAVKDWPLFE